MPEITLKDLELPELLTLKQAAQLLQVHPNSLRAWDRKGILKAVRIGVRKDRRFRKTDVIKLVNAAQKKK
ncbi:MAG: helix-turn-helix domain-containing protein [Candidatus Andersenbacteria bacterium]|nr:helix-turn-helix domain-containing protein [Candidatus Andersenbacteria bacterium]MBI3250362.1 helix-turn-helix domain-containing protein [Candidatus Andersenbacteria bacterium]